MIFNINWEVRFILTVEGERIIQQHNEQLNREMPAFLQGYNWFLHHKPLDNHGTRSDQLWHLLEIFGPHMHMGAPPFFVGNNLELLEPQPAQPFWPECISDRKD